VTLGQGSTLPACPFCAARLMFRGQTSCQSCGKGLSTWVGEPLAASGPPTASGPRTPTDQPTPVSPAAPAVSPAAPSMPASAPLFESFKLPPPTTLASASLLSTQSAPVAAPAPDRMLPAGETTAPASHAPVTAPSYADRSALNEHAVESGWPAQTPEWGAPPPHAAAPLHAAAPPHAARPRPAQQGQPAGTNQPVSGGRTWDPDSRTWWSSAPNTRPPRRQNQGQQATRNSGCAILFVIAIALMVIGSIASSANQSNSNDYPYDTPYFVNDGGQGLTEPVAPDSPDQPAQSFVPAIFPLMDPLVATGGLSQARAEHTATLLPGGRVIVAGGISVPNSPAAVASIETYDPKTHSFTPTGHLLTARSGHTATLLKNGAVLFAGGTGSDGQTLASAEIYDPKIGKSHPTGDMPVARASASAVALDDGTVLVVGGTDGGKSVLSTEVWNPSGGEFKELADGLVNAGIVTAVKLHDGSVLVAGGDRSSFLPDAIEIYGPTGSIDVTTGPVPREGATSCLLSDGRVLIVGGLGTSGAINATAEILDPKGLAAISLVSLGAPRWHNTTTALRDGSALIVGGSDGAGAPIATVELYLPGSSTTTPVGTMAEARSGHTATLLADGSVLIVGGLSSSATAVADAGIYFPNGAPTASPSQSLAPANGSPGAQTQSVQP
jgi:hypothetical protein